MNTPEPPNEMQEFMTSEEAMCQLEAAGAEDPWRVLGMGDGGAADMIQNMMTEIKCEPEQFTGRIIFMSVYNDIVWGKKETKNCVLRIPST